MTFPLRTGYYELHTPPHLNSERTRSWAVSHQPLSDWLPGPPACMSGSGLHRPRSTLGLARPIPWPIVTQRDARWPLLDFDCSLRATRRRSLATLRIAVSSLDARLLMSASAKPTVTPQASRLAHLVEPLDGTFMSGAGINAAFSLSELAADRLPRLRWAWRRERHDPNASHCAVTGAVPRYFAKDENSSGAPWALVATRLLYNADRGL